MSKPPFRAVILAGGKGQRLYPYTTVFPKPLMPIQERPILEIVLRQLHHFGVRHVTLAVGYLAELIQTYFGNGHKLGLDISYSREEEPLGTAGPIRLVSDLDSDFLVMNGDILCSLDFSQMFDFHCQHQQIATVGTYPKQVKIDLGVLHIDSTQRITDYVEKPTLFYRVSMGIYFFKPAILNYIQPGEKLDLPVLISRLIEQNETPLAFPFDGYWLDIGRQEDYLESQDFFEKNSHLFHLDP